MKNILIWRSIWMYVTIVSTIQLVLSTSDVTSPRGKLEIITKYTSVNLPSKNSSQLRMGLRNDDANRFDSNSENNRVIFKSSEISDSTPSKSKSQKKIDQQSPINPMILSKNQRKIQLEEKNSRIASSLSSSPRDSYLDALEYSHSFTAKDPPPPRDYDTNSLKFTTSRRDYTIGPVYRAESNNDSGSSSGTTTTTTTTAISDSNAKQLKSEINKISRISHSSSSYPEKSYLPAGGDSYYGPPQQISYGNDYSGYISDSYSYKPPQSTYGPSVQISPIASSSYGPPPPYTSSSGHYYGSQGTSQQGMGSLQATYSTSYPLPDLLPLVLPFSPVNLSWPVSLKIDTFTLLKIVLKLIIFKMIVKVIAGICLLLFIPKLIHKKSDSSEEESRDFTSEAKFSVKNLNLLLTNVVESIKYYENMNNNKSTPKDSCTTLGCRIKNKLFVSDDEWNKNIQLFKSYLIEAQAQKEIRQQNR